MKKLLLLLIFISNSALAERYVPRLMSASERKTALEVLGFGSASKILANPYPLGGKSGVEIGISSEYIPVKDLGSLGDKSSRRSELNYYSLTVAKGLFYNVDTELHFTPGFQAEDVSAYGGQIRWGFYEFPFMPGAVSLVVHGSATNYASLLDTRTTGVDLIATFVIEDIALYFGGGEGRSVGTFLGGAYDSGQTESTTNACNGNNCENAYEDLRQQHTVFGASLSFSQVFAAFEINRYFFSTYSAKIGWRF
jgi:hypothetical protein